MTKIIVEIEDKKVEWEDGKLTGDKTLTDNVKFASEAKRVTTLIYNVEGVVASLDDNENFVAISAALLNADKEARLVEAPEEVWDYINSISQYEEGVIY